MGAQASTNVGVTTTDITTAAMNKCPKVSATNIADFNKLKFKAPDVCVKYGYPSKFTIDQSAGVKSDCVISNLQNDLATAIAKMDAKTQGGFGFQASTSASDISNQITQKLTNDCGKLDAKNVVSMDNVDVQACEFHFIQDATAQTKCKIDNLQKTASSVTANIASTAEGATFANFFGPYGWIIGGVIGLVVVIIVIALIIYAVKSSKDTSQGTDLYGQPLTTTGEETLLVGGFKFGFNIYSVLIIAIIILLLYYLYNSYYHTDKAITDEDIARLNKSVKDAQKIAKIDSDCKSTASASISDTKITDCGLGTKSPSYYDPFGASYADYYDESENGLDDFYKPLFDQMKC
jgi:hypothetical protein